MVLRGQLRGRVGHCRLICGRGPLAFKTQTGRFCFTARTFALLPWYSESARDGGFPVQWGFIKRSSGRTRSGLQLALVVGAALLVGWLSQLAVRWQPPLRPPDKDHELCVLATMAGEGHFEKSFSSTKTITHCYVAIKFAGRGDRVRLTLIGPNGFSFNGTVVDGTQFSWGRDFPPDSSILMTVDQDHKHPGVTIFVADQAFVRAGPNGWQILSRVWVVLFAVSGLLAWANRKSPYPKRQLLSAYVFKMVTLALTSMFFYLLFHEGGHALVSQLFGGGGFGRSDIWGIHGSPHAGGSTEYFSPWQRAATSFAGPATPTLVAWLLFTWWRSSRGRSFRSRHTVFDLFLTCLAAFLIFPYALIAGPMMVGLLSDGDWRGFIGNVPGPPWQVYLLLSVSVLVSLFILWRTLPHICVLFRTETEKIRQASVPAIRAFTA